MIITFADRKLEKYANFHELGHIILHGRKYISLENVDFAAANPEKEQEAHDFAVKHTFSK